MKIVLYISSILILFSSCRKLDVSQIRDEKNIELQNNLILTKSSGEDFYLCDHEGMGVVDLPVHAVGFDSIKGKCIVATSKHYESLAKEDQTSLLVADYDPKSGIVTFPFNRESVSVGYAKKHLQRVDYYK